MSVPEALRRPFMALRTLLAVLRRRGYDAPDVPWPAFRERFCAEDPDAGPVLRDPTALGFATRPVAGGPALVVVFSDEAKLGVKTLGRAEKAMELHGTTQAVVVARGAATPFAKNALSTLRQQGLTVDVFLESALVVDPLTHTLVPPHRRLEPAEAAAALRQLGLRRRDLPRLLQRDPVVAALGLRRGDVVRVAWPHGPDAERAELRVVV